MTTIFDEVRDVYCEALLAGYAGNTPGVSKATVPDQPGTKVIRYDAGPFLVVDEYKVVLPGQWSFGTTTIWMSGEIVWFMQYHGAYLPEVIPFLKAALRAGCQGDWYGGRGPYLFQQDGLTYMNQISSVDHFRDFSGREQILDSRGAIAGWHEYRGLWVAQM